MSSWCWYNTQGELACSKKQEWPITRMNNNENFWASTEDISWDKPYKGHGKSAQDFNKNNGMFLPANEWENKIKERRGTLESFTQKTEAGPYDSSKDIKKPQWHVNNFDGFKN
jgi:hypothetical protein